MPPLMRPDGKNVVLVQTRRDASIPDGTAALERWMLENVGKIGVASALGTSSRSRQPPSGLIGW